MRDHFPLQLRVTLTPYNPRRSWRRRKLRYDRKLIGSSLHDNRFSSLLDTFPGVPYNVDSTSHCHILTDFIERALVQAYPIERVAKRKEYISETTYAMVREGARLRKCFWKCERRFEKDLLYVVFGVWGNLERHHSWHLGRGIPVHANACT